MKTKRIIKNTINIPLSNMPSICVAISYSKHSYNYKHTNKYYHIANFMMLHCTHPLIHINTCKYANNNALLSKNQTKKPNQTKNLYPKTFLAGSPLLIMCKATTAAAATRG